MSNKKGPDGKGKKFLKKGKSGLLKAVFSRFGIILAIFIIQLVLLLMMFVEFTSFIPQFFGAFVVLFLLIVLYLLNTQMDPTSKITWLIIIMLMPVFGALLLVYTRTDLGHRVLKKKLGQISEHTRDMLEQDTEVMNALISESSGTSSLVKYLNRASCYPAYDKSEAIYFPSGESAFCGMKKKLREAKHFIFLEFFIIAEGKMWEEILSILKEKAKSGVEVRVMYDGTCEFSTLPHDYPKKLRELGILCKVFAPITPLLSTHYNYRDHRKILVIDGNCAFTGGVNFADEYINEYERFGHWKDAAIMIEGEAVKSFTRMFLGMWNINEKNPVYEEYLRFPTQKYYKESGYVVPYGDSPLDRDKAAERVYMDIINRAKDYVYIMSPYFIPDNELEDALKFAAERGVDTRLILPGIPDKKLPYLLAGTYFPSMIESGVKIYKYTPGFIHSKVVLSDDKKAVVGSVNLDYRSFYHHFECAAYLYKTDCIIDIKKDFTNTFTVCEAVTKENTRKEKIRTKLLGAFFKVLAPLM